MIVTGDQASSGSRVLIVANEFPPTGGGGVIRMAKLAKYLPRHGWRVTVLTQDVNESRSQDALLLADLPTDVIVERVAPPFRLARERRFDALPTPAADQRAGPILGRIGTLLQRAQMGFRGIVRAVVIPEPMIRWALRMLVIPRSVFRSPDVIVASMPPRSGLIAGLIASRRTGAPLVLDFRDDWSTNPYFASRVPWRRFLERRLEAMCVSSASAIVVVTDVSAARYASRYPRAANRISVIPNGFDPDDIPNKLETSSGAPADGQVTLTYIGSLHEKRDPSPFLRGLADVLATRGATEPPIRLRLMGDIGAWQETMVREILPSGIAEIESFRPQPEALAIAANADILVVITNAAEGAAALVPGKLYEYAALRRPVLIVAPDGPAARLVREHRLGAWGDPSVPDSVPNAIRSALALAQDPQFKGASDEFIARFDRRHQAEQWSTLLDQARRRLPV